MTKLETGKSFRNSILIALAVATIALGLIGCSEDSDPVSSTGLTGNSVAVQAVNPPASGVLLHQERVEIEIGYSTDQADSVQIFVTGKSGTTNTAYFAQMGIPKVGPGSGQVSTEITVTQGKALVDTLVVQMINQHGDTLDMVKTPVSLDFAHSFISNIQISPGSPYTLGIGEHVTVSFDCGTSMPNGFYAWAVARNDGRAIVSQSYQGSTLISRGRNSITRFFLLREAGDVDQVVVRMRDATNSFDLEADTVNVSYQYR